MIYPVPRPLQHLRRSAELLRDVLTKHRGTDEVNEGANALHFGRGTLTMSEPLARQ